ncbi:glycoside hydrolase family 5 protein [Moniliophthora roreri MCA 2997]|uniref:Glycoside hydrolase family 5 protein n=1 Tax=Moniliophthora roreri (strain MCA 2997) TaxID=1381753 RepID=V2XWD6_MONRO|nr:glycoside hydrolase family 5 protein [Moniliophthora roreri MCA 2997]
MHSTTLLFLIILQITSIRAGAVDHGPHSPRLNSLNSHPDGSSFTRPDELSIPTRDRLVYRSQNPIMHPTILSADALTQVSSNRPSDWGLYGQDQATTNSPNANTMKTDEEDECNPSDSDLIKNPPPVPNFQPFEQQFASVYRYRRQQSVNLGSWFVHEQWMTPSVFKCAKDQRVSEIDIASGSNAKQILEKHWDTFITQSDFEYLASIGINTVRLPIGYWSLGPLFCVGTPYQNVADVYENSWAFVVRAINMAAEVGIGVLVDLHGAVGSQNGQPHSGISDGQTQLFENQRNIDLTLNCLTFLMKALVDVTNVVGIQILNEPQNVDLLPSFYTAAISAMRGTSTAAQTFPLYLHDGFDLTRFSDYVNNRSDFVVQDHHSYFVFSPSDATEPASKHTSDVNTVVASQLTATNPDHCRIARHNLVIDEWSCALTPESLASEEDKDHSSRDFCSSQTEVYSEVTPGWSFWAYKKEDCDPAWCFLAAIDRGYLGPTFHSYNISDPGLLKNIQYPLSLIETTSAPGQTNLSAGLGPIYAQINALSLDLQGAGIYSPSSTAPPSAFTYSSRSDSPLSPDQGFSDGFYTAKLFALHGHTDIDYSACRTYIDAFQRGLRNGEEEIASIVRDMA